MIEENSGKIFQFKLDHDLGYGFAEFYDFSDISNFYGRYIFVYNKVVPVASKTYNSNEITSSGIALGPITLYKSINTKGKGAWKLISQTDNFILAERPKTKELNGLEIQDDNWDNFNRWHISGEFPKDGVSFLKYSEVRSLETRFLNSHNGVAKKFTMMRLIELGKRVQDFYDLNQIGNRNIFVQLVNTYFPLEKTKELLLDIPKISFNNGS